MLCLQEMTPRTRDRWVEVLSERGFHVAVSSFGNPPQDNQSIFSIINFTIMSFFSYESIRATQCSNGMMPDYKTPTKRVSG